MKKRLFVFFVILMVFGCDSSTLSLKEIKNVPNSVQEIVDSNLKLQLISDGGKGFYIVIYSKGDIETNLETKGKDLIIKIDETNLDDTVIKQKTFYLTTDAKHDSIDVLVNGISTPFDNITVQ
ncbi:peptidylprolyl isomerase [Lysinibacillus endophyticus]|uniref:peptidylprolyl isomerase n=1 Tax=Ureibacillus endophyticus TaxID=1978490 RepID=UPI0031347E33